MSHLLSNPKEALTFQAYVFARRPLLQNHLMTTTRIISKSTSQKSRIDDACYTYFLDSRLDLDHAGSAA
jgi:hypothetical protein